jgi:hypothetical protein
MPDRDLTSGSVRSEQKACWAELYVANLKDYLSHPTKIC